MLNFRVVDEIDDVPGRMEDSNPLYDILSRMVWKRKSPLKYGKVGELTMGENGSISSIIRSWLFQGGWLRYL